jgi:hypothetical protein
MMEVAEFVNDDVVNDRQWGHHALPVKGDIPFGRAGTPSIAEIA